MCQHRFTLKVGRHLDILVSWTCTVCSCICMWEMTRSNASSTSECSMKLPLEGGLVSPDCLCVLVWGEPCPLSYAMCEKCVPGVDFTVDRGTLVVPCARRPFHGKHCDRRGCGPCVERVERSTLRCLGLRTYLLRTRGSTRSHAWVCRSKQGAVWAF